MRIALLEKVRALLHPAPHVAMKDPAFGWHFDDLGQFEGDLERKVKAGAPAPPRDEDAPHLEDEEMPA